MPFFGVVWAAAVVGVVMSVIIAAAGGQWMQSAIVLWLSYGLLMIVTVALFIDRYWKLVPRD